MTDPWALATELRAELADRLDPLAPQDRLLVLSILLGQSWACVASPRLPDERTGRTIGRVVDAAASRQVADLKLGARVLPVCGHA